MDAIYVLEQAMQEYEQWRNYRQYDVSVESYLNELQMKAKAEKYAELMAEREREHGTKRNTDIRVELVEGPNGA